MNDPVNKKKEAVKFSIIKDLSLNKLFEQMDNHKSHLKFLQENETCSPEEKKEILSTIKEIYLLISNRTKGNNTAS